MSDAQGKAAEISAAEQITALRASRLLNPEMSLRDIVAAAQKIPGLGDGSAAAWELINRDFVYKGRAIGDGGDKRFNALNVQGTMALQDSKILNFDITLGSILDMSARIPGIQGSAASWELVTRDFVLRGGAVAAFREAASRDGGA